MFQIIKKPALLVMAAIAVALSVPSEALASELRCGKESNAEIKRSSKSEKEKKGFGFKKKADRQKPDFSELADEGVISKETAEKINKYLEERHEKRLAEKEKIKEMSPEDRDAFFESKKKTPRVGIWTEMVNEGIITQAESDSIKEALQKKHKEND
ncbi:MAG: hypothetical protein LBU32_12040 [Clostridiales bacterium]|nr:hypothetical protein [Clostridiales bacterium]